MAELVRRYKQQAAESGKAPETFARDNLISFVKNVEEYVLYVSAGRQFVHSAADANLEFGLSVVLALQELVEERYRG